MNHLTRLLHVAHGTKAAPDGVKTHQPGCLSFAVTLLGREKVELSAYGGGRNLEGIQSCP